MKRTHRRAKVCLVAALGLAVSLRAGPAPGQAINDALFLREAVNETGHRGAGARAGSPERPVSTDHVRTQTEKGGPFPSGGGADGGRFLFALDPAPPGRAVLRGSMYQSLKEIIRNIQDLEKDFRRFLDGAEKNLENERSLTALRTLRERLAGEPSAIERINPDELGSTEFVKNVPVVSSRAVLPDCEVRPGASPEEVFTRILEREERLKELYTRLRDVVVYSKSREICDMIVQEKMKRIKEIKGFLDGLDLAL